MSVLAIDYGDVRVGLAYSGGDTIERLAAVPNDQQLISRLISMVKERNIETILVGLPRNLDGEDTPQSTVCRTFAAELSKQLDIPVELVDEAGTTSEARIRLEHQKLRPAEVKQMLDSEAASIIMEDYIRGH